VLSTTAVARDMRSQVTDTVAGLGIGVDEAIDL
jgi:hypothetical protein